MTLIPIWLSTGVIAFLALSRADIDVNRASTGCVQHGSDSCCSGASGHDIVDNRDRFPGKLPSRDEYPPEVFETRVSAELLL